MNVNIETSISGHMVIIRTNQSLLQEDDWSQHNYSWVELCFINMRITIRNYNGRDVSSDGEDTVYQFINLSNERILVTVNYGNNELVENWDEEQQKGEQEENDELEEWENDSRLDTDIADIELD